MTHAPYHNLKIALMSFCCWIMRGSGLDSAILKGRAGFTPDMVMPSSILLKARLSS